MKKGSNHSEKSKLKTSKALKGRIFSLKTLKKMSKSLKLRHKLLGHPFKGRHHSKEAKLKISLMLKGKYLGKNNPGWKGGSKDYYAKIAKAIYSEHHTNIICEQCSSPNNIHIHHKDENLTNNSIKNLQALCLSCHMKLHLKRNPWKKRNFN